MTSAQLKSAIKRINQQVVQHEKTFGKNSPAYNRIVSEIEIRFNGHTHTTKSGHIAIDAGAYLEDYQHQINILDRSDYKVKGLKDKAVKLLNEESTQKNYKTKTSKSTKYTKQQITNKVNEITELSDFLNNKLGDFYALRNEIPEINELLSDLETDGKKSYSELLRIKDALETLREDYFSNTISDEELKNKKEEGTKFLSEDI